MTARNAPLTDREAAQAKVWLLEGYTQGEVARALGRSIVTIGRLARGETYQHVKVMGEERLHSANRLAGEVRSLQMAVVERAVAGEAAAIEAALAAVIAAQKERNGGGGAEGSA